MSTKTTDPRARIARILTEEAFDMIRARGREQRMGEPPPEVLKSLQASIPRVVAGMPPERVERLSRATDDTLREAAREIFAPMVAELVTPAN